jgi:hypothetical protein
MKQLLSLVIISVLISNSSTAQKNGRWIDGMYFQWGYNTEWYTKSNIKFNTIVNGVPHNFTLYNVKAKDKPDFDGIYKNTIEISIPQYNYRIGFYINKQKTKALEINFDHTKYVIENNQNLRMKGIIGSKTFDVDTSFNKEDLHLEHTDGANFLQVNYVQQKVLRKKNNRPQFTFVWKAGAGIVIPRTDATVGGKRIDNWFHVAGYCLGVEAGSRWYFARNWFLETTAKTGYARYTNALAIDGGKISHGFGYVELIATAGYQFMF